MQSKKACLNELTEGNVYTVRRGVMTYAVGELEKVKLQINVMIKHVINGN